MLNTDGLIEHPTPNPYPFGPVDVASVLTMGLSEYPDRIAIIDGDREMTWTELDRAVGEVSAGIEPGQLCWWPPGNSAEKIISILATMRSGAIWIAHKTDQTNFCTDFQTVTVDFAVQKSVDRFAPALVAFTSGTTGTPKAVVHSQHSMLGPGLVSIDLEPPMPGERIGTPLDIGNANIFMLGPLSALLRGATFVVLPSRHAPALANDIERHAVTRLFAVPTLAFDLLESDEVTAAQLRSLDRVILGGSGAEPDLLSRFDEVFGVRPTLSYGLSEAPTGIVRESLDDPIGSGRGFPLPHIEIEILNAAGDSVDVGTTGEIHLRPASSGPWANTWTGTLGYLGEPERTAALFHNGRLRTGDVGHLDQDGALSVTGRLSNLIIRGGQNIDPSALETTARSIEGVFEASVLGLHDDRLGQIVALVVNVDPMSEHSNRAGLVELARTIARRCDAHIDAVASIDLLPRNEMGKVDQPALRSLFTPDTMI